MNRITNDLIILYNVISPNAAGENIESLPIWDKYLEYMVKNVDDTCVSTFASMIVLILTGIDLIKSNTYLNQ